MMISLTKQLCSRAPCKISTLLLVSGRSTVQDLALAGRAPAATADCLARQHHRPGTSKLLFGYPHRQKAPTPHSFAASSLLKQPTMLVVLLFLRCIAHLTPNESKLDLLTLAIGQVVNDPCRLSAVLCKIGQLNQCQ